MGQDKDNLDHMCGEIARRLAAFRADASRIIDLQFCLEKLAWLREEYRTNPDALASRIDALKDISRQVRETITISCEVLTAKYLEAVSAVAAWETVREACRAALLELSNSSDLQRMDSPQGWIEVKRTRAITMPKPGTPQREQLLSLIARAQRWPDVAIPSPARLLKAIDAGLFVPEDVDKITQLCPAQTVCRLAAHPRRQQAVTRTDAHGHQQDAQEH